MRYAEFERHAARAWEEIPEHYRAGVDGLVLERGANPHPSLPDIFTLGECLTESYPSEWQGPETTRSVLVLYYGSFRELSARDPDFDWAYEIWETVTHELRHHLESLAVEDALEDVDYAMDENFKRLNGDPFDPHFYRSGEEILPGVFEAERDVFVEVQLDPGEDPGPRVEFDWAGRRWGVPAPSQPWEVAFLQIVEGIDTGDMELCIVVVRRRRWVDSLRSLLRPTPPVVVQAEARAEARDP